MTTNIKALFNSNEYACFIEKKLVQQLKLPLVKKITLVVVEVIDG
jgi:hypothetical protein